MNQPHRPLGPDDLPPTQHLNPTPTNQRAGSTAPDEILATLPVDMSRVVARQTSGNGAAVQGPRYSRKDLHARGGLGEVFLAQDQELPREVALKEIRADRDDEHSRLRFVIEGTITGSLEHPGIVPVYSLGKHDDGRPFYAMRFVRGKTLQQAIAELMPLDFGSAAFRQLLQKFVTVCQTLQYTHDRGVIHRDLKPANIMVGDYGETLVVDWGLAKFIGQTDIAASARTSPSALSSDSSATPAETEQGVVLGTPAYMSPEQALGRIDQLTAATDIYALGATLYHLLTGQNPLKQPGQYQNPLERVQEGDIAPPRAANHKIPRALEAVCLKAMALEPANRYAHARDLAADLERWLADEPLAVYREPIHIRASRWLRKHPAIAATGVTSLALAVIAAVVISAISSTYSQQLTTAYNKLNLQHGELAFTHQQLSTSHEKLDTANRQLVQVNADLKVARDEAKENEKEAVAREKESNAVLDFLEQRILVAARPELQEGGEGRNVLLREAIATAGAHIEESFASQPLIALRLHRTLGKSLLLLGENQQAAAHFLAAKALIGPQGAARSPESLANAIDLALAHRGRGDLYVARDQLLDVIARSKAAKGDHDLTTLTAMHELADVQQALGKPPEALRLRQLVFAERLKQLGPMHHDTLVSQASLAGSLIVQNKPAEAVKLAEAAYAGLKESRGPVHPETLAALRSLAEGKIAVGEGPAALKMYEQLLQDLTTTLGPDHVDTLKAMEALAYSYLNNNRVFEATTLFSNATDRQKSESGPNHLDSIRLDRNLGSFLIEARRFQEAARSLEDTLGRARASLGVNHLVTIDCMRLLANAYGYLERHQRALELHIEAYVRCRDSIGPEHPVTLERMFDLAVDYNRMQVYPKALELREQLSQIQRISPGTDHPDTMLSINACAQSHLMLRQADEAYELLIEVLELREKFAIAHEDAKDNACHIAYTLAQLGHAEELRGNWEKGTDWYRQCAEEYTKLREKYGELGDYFDNIERYYIGRSNICRFMPAVIEDIESTKRQPRAAVAELLEGRLHHMRRTKDLAGAVETAERLEASLKGNLTTAYRAGVAWSLVSEMPEDAGTRAQYASRAIRLLERVSPKPGAQFTSDVAQAYAFQFNPDLDPIREQAGFRAIMQKLPTITDNPIWRDQKR